MEIQINTDKNIVTNVAHNNWLHKTIETALLRYKDKITRIELHLSDENAGKNGPEDKKCLLEARPVGIQPVVVTSLSETIDQAVLDALDKMDHLLKSLFERKNEHQHSTFK
jgi:hypothetical protein